MKQNSFSDEKYIRVMEMYDLFNSFNDSFGFCPHNETHSAFF